MCEPISREQMQGLKVKSEIEEYNEYLQAYIKFIYDRAVHVAKKSSNTKYIYEIKDNKAIIDHIDEVIIGLKYLFPRCMIKHCLMASNKHGQLFDITTLTDDDLKNVEYAVDNSYIVIDWS